MSLIELLEKIIPVILADFTPLGCAFCLGRPSTRLMGS